MSKAAARCTLQSGSIQLCVLLAVTFLYMGSIMMPGPVMAGFCATLGGSGMVMGLVGGLSNVTSLCCRPFLGNLIDRGSWKTIGLFGFACMGGGATICALAPTVWVLLLGRVFTGMGYAVCSGTLSTWVATSLPPERLGQSMGLYGMLQAVAQALAPAVGLRLAHDGSPRAACAVAAGLAVLGCILLLPLKDARLEFYKETKTPSPVSKHQLLLPELLPIAIIVLLFCIPYNGASAFLATVAGDRGLSFSVGPFFTIYALFLLVARFFLNRSLDRIPFRKFVVFCVPFGVVSMLCLQWMQTLPMMIAAAFFLTFAYGMIQPICQTAGVKSVSVEHRGLANCTYYMGLDIGLSFGPMLSGALYQTFGGEHLFAVLACVPLLALLVLVLFRKKFVSLGL